MDVNTMEEVKALTLAEQNDLFRMRMSTAIRFLRGTYIKTRGIDSFSAECQKAIFNKVRTFDTFTEDNDPHGEHNFGAFTHDGQKIFWKIDCYDIDLLYGSENPVDPEITRRVLTVMLASEY